MNTRQKELMEQLYATLKELSIEYQHDENFKKDLDQLSVFGGNVVDAYNTVVTWETLHKK